METLSDKIPNLELKTHKGDNYEFKTIEGFITLPTWQSFQSRQGAYSSVDKSTPSDGSVKISIGGDMTDDNPQITNEHVSAYNFVTQHQKKIKSVLLTALKKDYKNLQDLYDYDEESSADIMPNVNNISQFKSLIGLSTVHIMNVSKDGIAYVGYEFGCRWDDEHGLGIMTHKHRVVKIGLADTSFLTWIAQQDKSPETNELAVEKLKKNPWWKFW